jgi:actin
VKAGFAGQDYPSSTFANVLYTHPKFKFFQERAGKPPENANSNTVYNFRHVVHRGVITDFDGIQKVWRHAFENELKVASNSQPVFLVDSLSNPSANRAISAQVMFETFQVPAFHIANSAVLSLFGQGKLHGTVVESGYGTTHVVPIYEGTALSYASRHMSHMGGQDLTEFLARVFRQGGFEYAETEFIEIAKDIKELLSIVAYDYDTEMQNPSLPDEIYVLPDGQQLYINKERYMCPEMIFQPHLNGSEQDGIAEVIHKSIQRCGIDIRRDLYSEILLSGGNTMFPGFAERLRKEVGALNPIVAVHVDAPDYRKDLAWYGAASYCSLGSFNQYMWITKQEYEEYGPDIINSKCV